jgi:HTH-type transcriptional regulator, competence development regulator
MITAIGKELRKLRVDRDERLLDMADRLEKSASFISAVEVGKKAPAAGLEELVIKAYGLAEDAAAALRRAADASRKAFLLEPNSALGRDTAGLLARRMNGLSDEQLREIQTILQRKHSE